MGDGIFAQAFVYLLAAVIAVPVAKRLGLGSVLGYLIAGVVIGPYALGFVGTEGQDVLHFAEFGVVMMLFLVGLELKPSLLWELRRPIFGMGGLQVVGTTAAPGKEVRVTGIPGVTGDRVQLVVVEHPSQGRMLLITCTCDRRNCPAQTGAPAIASTVFTPMLRR